MFKVNESVKDRINRAIIGGLVLIVAAFLFTGWLKIVGTIVGIILIFTAITGFCALYRVFNISTVKKELKVEEPKTEN